MKKALKITLICFASLVFVFALIAVANLLIGAAMGSYVDSFSPVMNEGRAPLQYGSDGIPYFTDDGEFKIVQITDVHIGGGFLSVAEDKKAFNAVAAMISEEKPDLVVVTGDISFAVPYISGTINNAIAHKTFIRFMERLGVYWTLTLGNHDSESYNYFGREAVARMYSDKALRYCLFSSEEGVSGEGNHRINVKNSRGFITESLYMIDSHAYTENDPLGIKWDYDHIKEDQIALYREWVEEAREYNAEVYATLGEDEKVGYGALLSPKSLMFMHIPLREVKTAVDEYLASGGEDTADTSYIGGAVGEDDPYVYPSMTDEMLFEAALELGSTTAIFFGHDHLNSINLEYKGIRLSYGLSIDYLAYSGIDKLGAQRGCSVITVSENGEAEVTHENYYQEKYTPLYHKEEVDMSPVGE